MPFIVRRLLRIVLATAVGLGVFVAFCNVVVLAVAHQEMHDTVAAAPARPTVIVLGARVFPQSGRLSDMLGDRMQTALELYRAGKAERFLLSGDHGTKEYDEVNAMKDFLLDRDVPAEDIFLDHAGFDTYDSMYRARDVFQVDGAIVVTQGFHLPRAVFIGRSLGIDAVGVKADRQEYVTIFYNHLREIPSRVKACLNATFRTKPKFLGEVIPITGDAKKSWDRE